jgi:predicted CoA-substrate-specific enzyme activase
MTGLFALGIDVGSTTVKFVGIDQNHQLVLQHLEQTEPRIEDQLRRLLEDIRRDTDFAADIPIIATGYGRALVPQSTRIVTEITCHARGVFQELAHGGTLIDIGGQDSKVIRISPQGKVLDFTMNDKCAAGTGRFLENTARRMAVPLEEMGPVAMGVESEVPISSTCTVFAESEIISLIAHGAKVPEILRGLHRSLVQRIVAMVNSVGFEPPLMLSGGVVKNALITQMISELLGTEAILPRYPQMTGAFGAALIALTTLVPKGDNFSGH